MQLSAPRRIRGLLAGLVVTLPLLVGGTAHAQSVKQVGVYRDWTVYSANSGNGTVCFAMSKPSEVAPSPDGYTQAYLYLSSRPADSVSNEINLVAGSLQAFSAFVDAYGLNWLTPLIAILLAGYQIHHFIERHVDQKTAIYRRLPRYPNRRLLIACGLDAGDVFFNDAMLS